MRKFWTLVVSGAMTVGVAFGALAVATTDTRVNTNPSSEVVVLLTCPEEDSCTPHYDGVTNRWTITRP